MSNFKAKEEKGTGLNYDHPSPIIRDILNDRLEIKINHEKRVQFKEDSKSEGGMSKVLRKFIDEYKKEK